MNENIYGKYGCWWEGGTGVSPDGIQCGECYPSYEDKCPHLKEIREIYSILMEGCNDVDCIECEGRKLNDGCLNYHKACKLYTIGYRKQSEVEKLENKLFEEVFEGVLFSLVYLGADGKWHTKRNNAEKTTAIIERYLKLVAIKEGGE